MFLKFSSILLSFSLLTGCATIHRHPRVTRVVIVGAGVGVGAYLGWRSSNVTCVYENKNVGVIPRSDCPPTEPKGSRR